MDDFQDALRARLTRNVELEHERQNAEQQRLRDEQERAERDAGRAEARSQARARRHAELVERLRALLGQLEAEAAESVVSRSGFSETGEEFVTEVTTVRRTPRRTLFIELDRDDDEVLARWTSEVGDSIEMWRLLDFAPEVLDELVLQVVDDELWHSASRPPAFPG
ncbi:MAG: hypothetical protein M3N57_03415 [Actinomycetota bacterium]|nr:hypothetical protein [Actinomycetota bacterium]